MELEALQANLEHFKQCGASVVVLCPQLPEHNESVTKELGLQFPVLQDRDNSVAEAFGLLMSPPEDVIEAERFLGLELPEHNGTDSWDLPIPSRYVLEPSGTVRFASLHVDYRTRSEPSECFPYIQ